MIPEPSSYSVPAMSSQPLRRRATYQDILDLPDNVTGQLVDGELIASPQPVIRHQWSASALGGDLFNPFHRGRGGPGGWWIIDEPELHLEEDILVPDIGGWRKEKLPILPDEPYFTLAPDWVCEVLSPSTARIDRIKKLPIYAREGVSHVWLIDPDLQTLEVFRLEGQRWLLLLTAGGDEVVRAEPFDAIELELAGLWIQPAAAEPDRR
ncbi:MAG: Uma2 family endonuclease [Thermoanaerobaculia bacterium]|nr:hypothetical protein [Thermoanaerobaculia bacterium]MCK6683831.1 Uma2 family endonuclease [Thermoanaerobaculia bacterium]